MDEKDKTFIREDDKAVIDEESTRSKKKQKKEQKKARKESKKKKKMKENITSSNIELKSNINNPHDSPGIVSSSAKYSDEDPKIYEDTSGVTLLLFYQYVEPPWTMSEYQKALQYAEESASSFQLTGRMRVAREGFNCTLTGTHKNIRSWCAELRSFSKPHFTKTEFKLTDHLPDRQRFPKLNCFHVQELVHYGLTGDLTPHIHKTGVHLEPQQYHEKMMDKDTVIIDVRNHYEAAIGHFTPPNNGAQLIDPKMRKSTEFPIWLDKPETKKQLKNKQVLMYCTGGVRCERASALLKHKMETENDVKDLNIKGVYQLQGGIDKYFKSFPDGGFWEGKNYTFDKRFAHAPPNASTTDISSSTNENNSLNITKQVPTEKFPILGKCEACGKPWDKYRGKRRCPTCGVPSLICKDCFTNDEKNIKKLDKSIRCVLCVEQNITSKLQIKQAEIAEMEQYALKQRTKLRSKGVKTKVDCIEKSTLDKKSETKDFEHAISNPERITRLFVKNMCVKSMDESKLCETLPGITHIQWLSDRTTGKFYGSAFVEMATPEDASNAVSKNGRIVLGRPIKIKFQKADGKDLWPPPNCVVVQ